MSETIMELKHLALAALLLFPAAAEAQYAQGNAQTNQLLRQGHINGQLQGMQRFGGSPPFPLFRCDGQRAPMVGGQHCQNWRIQDMQEKILRDEMRKRGLR